MNPDENGHVELHGSASMTLTGRIMMQEYEVMNRVRAYAKALKEMREHYSSENKAVWRGAEAALNLAAMGLIDLEAQLGQPI